MIRAVLILLALLGASAPAHAHSASTAYLDIRPDGSAMEVQWSIALRDLDYAIGLDIDGDGAITWREVEARTAAIDAYALSHLKLDSGGIACAPGPTKHLVDRHGDGAYLVLRFRADCGQAVRHAGVDYTALFDLDPLHRGLLDVVVDGAPHTAVLSPAQHQIIIDGASGFGSTFVQFFRTGIDHLLTGIDHLLFVSMLLVPAMFRRAPGPLASWSRWQAVEAFRPAFIETVKVLSAFTIAHALTLSSAVLGYVRAPAQLIEALIAVTILLTAIDNIWRILPDRRWALAFGFGLIHGFGFANALGPLALPPTALAAALLSFNLGLETAQVGVAAILLPLGFLARRSWAYRARFLPGLSGAVAMLALAWFTDRAAGLGLMPF